MILSRDKKILDYISKKTLSNGKVIFMKAKDVGISRLVHSNPWIIGSLVCMLLS